MHKANTISPMYRTIVFICDCKITTNIWNIQEKTEKSPEMSDFSFSGPKAISRCVPGRRQRRRQPVAGKPLIHVPKLCFSRKYSGLLRSPQKLKFPGTPGQFSVAHHILHHKLPINKHAWSFCHRRCPSARGNPLGLARSWSGRSHESSQQPERR